jgi:hypothetical protein
MQALPTFFFSLRLNRQLTKDTFEEGGAARERTRVIMPLARFLIVFPPAAFAVFPVDARTDDPFPLKNEDESFQGFDAGARCAEKIVTAKGKVTIKLEPLAGRYPFRGEFHDATAQSVLVVE